MSLALLFHTHDYQSQVKPKADYCAAPRTSAAMLLLLCGERDPMHTSHTTTVPGHVRVNNACRNAFRPWEAMHFQATGSVAAGVQPTGTSDHELLPVLQRLCLATQGTSVLPDQDSDVLLKNVIVPSYIQLVHQLKGNDGPLCAVGRCYHSESHSGASRNPHYGA